ncbi:LADA_0G05248g1_1 [Lachancea dasiensis]|uniref:LADA_0G05248g1_1 n=1 Tax=Lachancea dasiensis TaxID=1072105 RepID=A0A1G4JSM7_9SACH|nr:LADA_0G05248g1_1 [Lachancea dasiensis]
MAIQLWGSDNLSATDERDPTDRLGLVRDPGDERNERNSIRESIVAKASRVLLGVLTTNAGRMSRVSFLRVSIIHWVLLVVWLSLLARFSTIYAELYSRTPLLTTICSNGLLFGISDILAQGIHQFIGSTSLPLPQRWIHDTIQIYDEDMDLEDNVSIFNDYGYSTDSSTGPETLTFAGNEAGFEFFRWACFMAWGAGLAFFQVPWYRVLNFFYTEDPTVVQTLERVLSDQLVYSPISLYCFFMYSNYVMERGDAASFKKKIEKIYLGTLGFNYLIWPPVQFINFLLVPKPSQVPFSSSVGVLWNCFLSIRNASNSV